MSNCTLSLPALAPQIPLHYTLYGASTISTPLAIALIELGMITEVDLAGREHESELVQQALTRWWNTHTAELTLFSWQLHVQQLNALNSMDALWGNPWFCITLAGDIPRFSLALRVGELEGDLEGFGQTVLAVLEDAFCYLPVAWTLGEVFGMATCVYWMGEADEVMALEEHELNEGEPVPSDFFTRAKFFEGMPEWAALPRRVRTRAECESAASSALGKNVIKTCDAISALVNSRSFVLRRGESGCHDLQGQSIEACTWIRWTDDDATGRVVDDYIDDVNNSGDFVEFIAAREVPAERAEIKRYLEKTQNMLQLAVLVEELMVHLGADSKPVRIRV